MLFMTVLNLEGKSFLFLLILLPLLLLLASWLEYLAKKHAFSFCNIQEVEKKTERIRFPYLIQNFLMRICLLNIPSLPSDGL